MPHLALPLRTRPTPQAAIETFERQVAARVPPDQEQQAHLAERLHKLAGQLDALLAGFWVQGRAPEPRAPRQRSAQGPAVAGGAATGAFN